MDKNELFDVFEDVSNNLMENFAQVELVKKKMQEIIEENTQLRIENTKLRERLFDVDKKEAPKASSQGLENLESIYEDGFHVCNNDYGKRRDDNEDCLFCMELLNRE
ncbi:DNA replication initiation control protein YabA [Streptococcus dentapri]|uniref:Replication initiation control protein YabA n=1 Tax=Streptococcus dentapri TaxID=573564 RepID=A0ABV8CZP9_9STRE